MPNYNMDPQESRVEEIHPTDLETSSSQVVSIRPDTRNHLGFFIAEETYTLVEETETGWAVICVDDSEDGFYTRCHFVNPADLDFFRHQD